ncbi:MAG: peptidoglycan editing factor PgeF [Candidatus Atribacteria bacterium]|nr:peptidoglycan editing factor PgeF [Candidatus Atribacteria bacterium]
MKRVVIRGVPFLQFENISSSLLFHAFTLKQAFFNPGDGKERERLKEVLLIDTLVTASQVHGTRWVVVDGPPGEKPVADALLTAQRGVCLGVLVADCLPLLFVDPVKEALAVVHAGWRGVVDGIHLEVLRAMETVFGSQVSDLLVGIGPGIGECCFAVGEEVARRFARRGTRRIREKEGYFFVDLPGVVQDELEEYGVKKRNIENSNLCTVCHGEMFHSFRREKELAGRNILLAGWQKRD